MLDSVLPLALYLLLGYGFKTFFHDNSKQLIEFVIYFALPAVVFSKIYPLVLDERIVGLIFMFMGIVLLNLTLAYVVGKLLKLNKILLATFMIVSTFGNTSFVGFSYIDAFYGDDYIVYGLIYDFFGSFLLLVSVGMMVITWGTGKKNNIKSIIKSVVLFPPMVVFFITIIAKIFDVPQFLLNTSDSLGSTLVPVAMIAIGMKLEIKHIFERFYIVSIALILKMLFVPILVLIGFQMFYNIDQTWVKVTIIEVAMPPMTMAAVLAIRGGLDEKLAINTLVIGVLLSLVTITAFASYLG